MADLTLKQYDEKIHNIYVKGVIDEDMWNTLVDKINEMKSADEEIDINNAGTLALIGIDARPIRPDVNIYLSTIGGYVYDMFAVYDEIKALTKEYIVNIYCVGKIMSAGTVIMLATDYEHRFAYPNTTFMYHSASSGTWGKIKEIEEDLEETKRIEKKINDIYLKETNITKEKLDEIYKCKKDWFISAEQAKKYKIISKIV